MKCKANSGNDCDKFVYLLNILITYTNNYITYINLYLAVVACIGQHIVIQILLPRELWIRISC